MSGDQRGFREAQPLAWSFHRNTCRWTYNAPEPPELRPPEPGREDPSLPLIPLSRPALPARRFDEVVAGRFSCRRFSDGPVPLEQLSTLLWSAYGVTGRSHFGPLELLERPVPSGGGLYPLELYAIVRNVPALDPGVYHYVPLYHGLERLRDVTLPKRLVTYLFMGQHYAADAAVVAVLTAVVSRSLWKYADRGYRYILLEAGHVAQNLNLTAAALELGSCNLGGFFDDELAGLLRVDVEGELPLYGVALGVPAGDERDRLRDLEP
jgi:SagB-type dehydrogenase family enzyme